MEVKYNHIYSELKELARQTIDKSSTDKLIEDFKIIVKERINEIHRKLDEKKEKFINLALEAYSKDVEKPVTEDDLKGNKKKKETKVQVEEKKESDMTKEEKENKQFKDCINGLVSSLDIITYKIKVLDETVDAFKDKKLNQIIDIKTNEFVFKHEKKLEFRMKGKLSFDLEWDLVQNKPTNSNIDSEDSSKLIIHANSCYNYYATSKKITDEVVQVMIATDIYKTDSYFYFGVADDTCSYNNNCMCCTPSSVTYIRCNGNVCVKGSSTTNNELKFDHPEIKTICIRVDSKEKHVYFTIDDREEQGPYELPGGSSYTIVSGSCNSANGFIQILSSQIIG